MAAPASAVVASLLERLRPRALDCRVCLREVTAATTALLPCCHAFHRACLAQQAEAHRGETLLCGVCGTEAAGVKTAEDVEKLPADVLLEAELAEAVHCALCEEEVDEKTDALAKCTTCNKPLCDAHRTLHKGKKFPGHVVEPLAVTARATSMCPAHPAKALDLYCATCPAVCCALCIVATHPAPEHQTCVLAAHAPELRKGLKRAYDAGTERSETHVKWLAGLQSAMTDVDARTAKLEDEVNRTMDVLVHRLALRREELLRELSAIAGEELAELEAEQDAYQRRWLAMEGALRAARQLTSETSLDHLGRLATPVEAYMTTALREAMLAPPAAARIDFAVSDNDMRVVSSVGRFVHSRAYGPECIAEGAGTAIAVVSGGGRFTVTAWTRSKERVTVGGDRVTARLVSAADGSATEATAADAGDGTYSVSYAVTSAGEYRLDVVVNGRAVRGSPFAVSVVATRVFTFSGPPYYDNNGVIYYLATAGGTRPWTNPHNAGVVAVSWSSVNSGTAAMFVANKVPVAGERCYTKTEANSWMSVSLNGKRVVPTGYVLSTDGHGVGGYGYLLRSWRLEASLDGTTWTTLRTHTSDTTLMQATLTGYWPVDGATSAFSHFRILQTGKNSTNSDHLMASSFEIYGELLDV